LPRVRDAAGRGGTTALDPLSGVPRGPSQNQTKPQNDMSTELILADKGGAVSPHRHATDVAGMVKEFALARVVLIQGKRYPPVEVWQAIANAFGCVASAVTVEQVDGGIRALGQVQRLSDGRVIATGEGFVGDDESTWAKRPMFARRAMAQTRSISRACRAAFAFVIPMIDAGIMTTPSEEMEAVQEASTPPMRQATVRPVNSNVDGSAQVFEAVLSSIRQKEGVSNGKAWHAWFLSFDGRDGDVGTFSESMATTAGVLQGSNCRVTIKAGKKANSWELVNIEPADEIPT